MVFCDRWVTVKVLEVLFCISCLVAKRVTDDEAVRLSLYLQKLSREWSLLRNITWSSVGASFGDAIYGGYVIITIGLLLGRIFEEIPKGRRILEGFLLGMGALFFIVLGGLELASVDSIPEGLIDNAAVLGVLSLMTAALFLIDLAGPKKIHRDKPSHTDIERNTFSYPKLPQEDKPNEKKTDQDANSTLKVTEKPKKPKKQEDNTNQVKPEPEKKLEPPQKPLPTPESDNDEVDAFIASQKEGYHKFNENKSDDNITFAPIERSKYGSVRNGNVKNVKEVETFQKTAPPSKYRDIDMSESDLRKMQYDEEISRNMAYLKLLNEKNALKHKLDEKEYGSELTRSRDQYIRDYKQSMILPIEGDKRNYPNMGVRDYERQKKWEPSDEETLPAFSIRENYLPELQTPVFSKVKEPHYYDNYAHFNIPSRRPESNHTDSLRSKNSTLKSKPPTLQQIAEYFGLEHRKAQKSIKKEAASQVSRDDIPGVSFIMPMSPIKERRDTHDYNGEPISPTDPGYVQYTAQNWNERLSRKSSRTPRHSPADE